MHGQHWKASSKVRGDPAQKPSTGAGAGNAGVASTWSASPGSITWYIAGSLTSTGAPFPEPPPEPPTVEDAGIKVGEIIAWRAWKIKDGWLYSVIADFEWPPGESVESKEGADAKWGFHAFKTRKRAIEYADGSLGPHAIGRIALWGDIVEFDEGWHGQCASVESIDLIVGIRTDVLRRPGQKTGWNDPIEMKTGWGPWVKIKTTPSLLDQVCETYGVGRDHL